MYISIKISKYQGVVMETVNKTCWCLLVSGMFQKMMNIDNTAGYAIGVVVLSPHEVTLKS